MVVNVNAYKSSKTSLSEIVPSEYLSSGNTNVNAYLHLNGPIMQRIEPTFSFELPNSSEEVNNIFFSSIDTTNKENLTRQFAYFMVTNNFMPAQMFSNSDRNNVPGLNMFSNIVNNMLGDLFATRNGSFGITYTQATETSSAEYGVTGSANLENRLQYYAAGETVTVTVQVPEGNEYTEKTLEITLGSAADYAAAANRGGFGSGPYGRP